MFKLVLILLGVYLNFILLGLYEEWFYSYVDFRIDFEGYKCSFMKEYEFDISLKTKKCSFERYSCKKENNMAYLIKYGDIRKLYNINPDFESYTDSYFMSNLIGENTRFDSCECDVHFSKTKVLNRCMALFMDGTNIVMRSRYQLSNFNNTVLALDETLIQNPQDNMVNIYKFISDSNLLLLS